MDEKPYTFGRIISAAEASEMMTTDSPHARWIELNVGTHAAFGFLVWCTENVPRNPDCERKAEFIVDACNQAMQKLPDRISEPRFVTTELDTLLSNLLKYVPHTQIGLIERVTEFRMAAKRNGLYLLADQVPGSIITNPVEAYETGRRAGVAESINNQTHAAFRLGEQQALASLPKPKAEHPDLNLLGTLRRTLQRQNPEIPMDQVDAIINNMNNFEILRYIGNYYGERKTD